MSSEKDLLNEAVDLINRQKQAQERISEIARMLGESTSLKPRKNNNGRSKKYKVRDQLLVLQEHPAASPERRWSISVDELEVVE